MGDIFLKRVRKRSEKPAAGVASADAELSLDVSATFSSEAYRALISSPAYLYADELSDETHSSKIRKLADDARLAATSISRVGLLASVLLFVKFSILLFQRMNYGYKPDWMTAVETLLGNPFVLLALLLIGLFWVMSALIQFGRYKKATTLQSIRVEEHVWIGGGPLIFAAGPEGISIGTNRSSLGLSWHGFLPQVEKIDMPHKRNETAIRLTLKSSHSAIKDTLIIPQRFFPEENETSWDEFHAYIVQNILPLADKEADTGTIAV